MDQFIMKVEIDGEKTNIQTFAYNVEGAIDNIVCMASVDKLFQVTETKTNEQWDFDEDITKLRELRSKLPDNLGMFFGIGNKDG